MAGVQVNRTATGVLLPQTVSNDIWDEVRETSVITRVTRQIDMPGTGVKVPIISGHPTASWVAETDEKPISRPTFGNKTVTPYKLAVIVPFSNEFRRDLTSLYRAVVRDLPRAIGEKFDSTVFGYAATPGTGFDTLAAAPTVALGTGTAQYTNLLTALGAVAAAGNGAALSHWIMSTQGEISLLGALDGNDRPLFDTNVRNDGLGAIGSLLGRPVVPSAHVYGADDAVNLEDGAPDVNVDAETLGMAGDFANGAVWGQVDSIQIRLSEQATINDGGTLLHLWQRNMFAVLVECEMAFAVRDIARFARLTGADLGT